MQGRIPAGPGRRAARGRARLRSERGAALIEIMMAALLVALAATAVFKGIDGASALSSASKSRAIAAALADDDQERLRALPPANLVDRSESRDVDRGGVKYTVASSSKWVADRDARPDCASTTSRAGYLRILTTVTWPDMQGSKPIVASGLVSPPNGTVTSNRGAMGIKILNEANAGVQGVSVTVPGASLSGTTDSSGCVYWDDVPQGNYSYTAEKSGYVDPNGATSITRPIGVSGGQTRLDTAYLDAAQTLTANFVTKRYGGAEVAATLPPTSTVLSESMPLHLSNAKMTTLPNGVLSTASSDLPTRSVSGLYPMPYGVYGGPCALANSPASYAANNPPAAAYQVSPPYTGVKPSLPSVNLRLKVFGAYQNGYTVKFTLTPVTGSSCTATYTRTTQNVPGVGDGALLRPELPYGKYTACVEGYYNNTWYKATKSVENLWPNGVDVLIDDSNPQTGRC